MVKSPLLLVLLTVALTGSTGDQQLPSDLRFESAGESLPTGMVQPHDIEPGKSC